MSIWGLKFTIIYMNQIDSAFNYIDKRKWNQNLIYRSKLIIKERSCKYFKSFRTRNLTE